MSNKEFRMEACPTSGLRKRIHAPLSAVAWLLLAVVFTCAARAIAAPKPPLCPARSCGDSKEPVRLPPQISSRGTEPETPGSPREGQPATRTFSSATYGVSFRYPASASLKAGNEAKMSWGWLGPVEMDFVQPGGVWVASVELPANSYPKTDFGLGFFSVTVNNTISASECVQFAYPTPIAPGIPQWPPVAVRLGVNELLEEHTFEGAMMKQASAYHYHLYANGACYEFILGLGTGGYGAVDGITQVDAGAVFERLREILSTVKIREATVQVVKTPIREFRAVPLGASEPHSFRVSWDVTQSEAGPLSLHVKCGLGLKLQIAQTSGGTERPADCQKPILLSSKRGFLVLRFLGPLLGERPYVHQKFTFSVGGTHPVSASRMVLLPTWVRIGYVFCGGNLLRPNGPVVLGRGGPVLLSGSGFFPLNTVRIGSTQVNGMGSNYGNFLSFAVPESQPLGKAHLDVVNGLGKSNSIAVVVRPPVPPRIESIKWSINKSGSAFRPKTPRSPFEVQIQIKGSGFLSTNVVWVGGQSDIVQSHDGSDISFDRYLAPSFQPYPVFIVNAHGKSKVATFLFLSGKN